MHYLFIVALYSGAVPLSNLGLRGFVEMTVGLSTHAAAIFGPMIIPGRGIRGKSGVSRQVVHRVQKKEARVASRLRNMTERVTTSKGKYRAVVPRKRAVSTGLGFYLG